MKKKKIDLGIHIALIVSCLLGITLQLAGSTNFMGAAQTIFRAFTVQSNVWIASLSLVYLIYAYVIKKEVPHWLYILKYMFTVAILLTYTVFAVILSPVMTSAYLWSPSNWFLHTITPLLALASYLQLDVKHLPLGKQHLFAIVMPILYAIYFLAYYAFIGSQPVPYFFLDYQVLGWFTITSHGIGVIYWILLISLLVIGLGYGLTALSNKTQDDASRMKKTYLMASLMISLSLIMTLLNPLF